MKQFIRSLGREHEHATQDRRDRAPRSTPCASHGYLGSAGADARFGGELELGGADFGRRAVRPGSGRHSLQHGQIAQDILKDIRVNTSISWHVDRREHLSRDCRHGDDLAGGATATVPVGHTCRGDQLHTLSGCRNRYRDALRRRPHSIFCTQSRSHRASRLSRHHSTRGASHHADPHRSSAHYQSIPRFSRRRNLDLDVGTGRRVPGRAHSPVRDGGVASAVIDRQRERGTRRL